jgi:hypothetical protein
MFLVSQPVDMQNLCSLGRKAQKLFFNYFDKICDVNGNCVTLPASTLRCVVAFQQKTLGKYVDFVCYDMDKNKLIAPIPA